jgi:hypothetical protein
MEEPAMGTKAIPSERKSWLSALAISASLLAAVSARADVVSWFSLSNALDGTAAPHAPEIVVVDAEQTGTLYIWAQNTAKLNSLAYDVVSSDTSLVQITARQMYNPKVFGVLDRWDAPVNQGSIDAAGNLLNMYGIAVTAQGLNPLTRADDAGWDDVAQAALIGEIQYRALGHRCLGVFCPPVQLQLQDGAFGTVAGLDPENTTNHFATIRFDFGGGDPPPMVDDIYYLRLFRNEIIGPLMLMDTAPGIPPVTWSDLMNFSYEPAFGAAPPSSPGIHHQPTWDPLTQKFNWDTSGSSPGRYMWEVTASNAFGEDSAKITVDLMIPEPATIWLVGLTMIGLFGTARRRD